MGKLGRKLGRWAGPCGAAYDARRVLGKSARIRRDYKIDRLPSGEFTWRKLDKQNAAINETFGPMERKIYAALFVGPKTFSELTEIIYPGADGGPEWAESCVSATICLLNRKLESLLGQHIASRPYLENRFAYQIEFVDRKEHQSCGF